MGHANQSHAPNQSIPPNQSFPANQTLKPSQAQIKCEADGGTWDATTLTCIPKVTKAEPLKGGQDPVTGTTIFNDDGSVTSTIRGVTQTLTKEEHETRIRGEARSGGGVQTEGVVALREAPTAEQVERARLVSEESPSRRELDPFTTPAERLPVVGGIIGVLSDHLAPLKDLLGVETNELQPEELRTMALSEIERMEVERGLTSSEGFGRLVEGTGLGTVSLFGFSIKDLIETPSENAKEVKKNIKKEKTRISNIETNVKLGYLPVSVATEQITDIENNVQRLESRLRLLISKSPELRFNSDFVNTVETEILTTREKIFQAKSNILTGQTADPTEVQILQKLLELQGDSEE